MRRISRRLTEAGVRFDAEMTSNGSLFTEALAQEAAEAWKLSRIQITLDGKTYLTHYANVCLIEE